jgi:hypothetical protein
MVRTISDDERRARLAHRHRLTPQGRTDDVAAIADSVVALHSSDPVSVYLSAMARMSAPSVDAVEKALYVDRSVVRHHAMRRTLWVATPEVARLMHAAATRKLVGPEHRRTAKLLAANGVEDPERWLADARARTIEALEVHGPMTARALGQKVPALRQGIVMAPGKKYSATISAHTRVLLLLGFEGHVVRTRPTGTWVNGAYTYAPADDWVEGGLDGHAERGAARELALRWLQRFGPGTAADLQWWAGWTVATTRTALVDCGAVELRLAGAVEVGYVAPGDEEPVSAVEPWVALLPGLDPTTMGWKQRSFHLDPELVPRLFDRNGNGGPTLWVDGRVVGGWGQRKDGEIVLRIMSDVGAAAREALQQQADDLQKLLGEVRFSVRFPAPLQAELGS